ncbi:hypothetical protein ACOSQ2_017539 [Xanthoceras sorbifolium]
MNQSQNLVNKEPVYTKKQRQTQTQLITKNLNLNLPIKLDPNNYNYWKVQLSPAIRAFGLEEYVYSPLKCPSKFIEFVDELYGEITKTYNNDYLDCKKNDQMIVCWLLTTFSEPIYGQVSHCVTTNELWNCITQLYLQNSLARVLHLRSQLQTLKKRSLSVTNYIVKMKGITDLLLAVGQTVTERDLVAYILGGIGQEYDPVVVTITTTKEDVILQDIQFL